PGEWFTHEVIVSGNRIIIKVDGKTTVDFTDAKGTFPKGCFALQQHHEGSVVEFKRIEISNALSEAAKKIAAWRKAAEKGDAEAMYQLGLAYRYGRGAKQDYKEAMAWFRKAVDNDHAPAIPEIAIMYLRGLGVAKNDKEAVAWSRKGADKGIA